MPRSPVLKFYNKVTEVTGSMVTSHRRKHHRLTAATKVTAEDERAIRRQTKTWGLRPWSEVASERIAAAESQTVLTADDFAVTPNAVNE